MPNAISKVVSHIRNGTLLERFKKRKLVKLDKTWNDFLSSEREYIDMKVTKSSKLRLYKSLGSSKKIFMYDAEKEEVEFTYDYLRPGDTFLDIGAHIGYFVVAGAAKVGKSGSVHAFEPTPDTLVKLRENVIINQFENVVINDFALSDSEGTINIFSHPQNEAYNTMASQFAEGSKAIEIQTKKLDDYASKNGLVGNIDFIKIDVEGWETFVFKGAKKVLGASKKPVIMMELSAANQKAAGSSCLELYQVLSSFGYGLYTYSSGFRKFTEFELTPEYEQSLNIFAIADLEEVIKRRVS